MRCDNTVYDHMLWALQRFSTCDIKGGIALFTFRWQNRGYSWGFPVAVASDGDDYEDLAHRHYCNAARAILRDL